MKRQLIVSLSLGLAFGLLSPSFTFAQGSTEPSSSATELKARLENRKTKLEAQPSKAETTRIAARCVAAQQKLAAIPKKFSGNDTALRARYEAQIARLEKIVQQADERGADTADLKKNIENFNQKYQAMVSSVNSFNLSISDLSSVDCKADPTAFKATLTAARTELQQVQAARKELTELMKGPLLESVKALKKSLESKQG